MHIISNWKARTMLSLSELPEKVRADFDYIDAEESWSPRFVCYRGQWIDCNDTQRIEPDNGKAHPMGWALRVHPGSPLCHFDSVVSDSYFSGTLIRFVDDESVIVGRYFC